MFWFFWTLTRISQQSTAFKGASLDGASTPLQSSPANLFRWLLKHVVGSHRSNNTTSLLPKSVLFDLLLKHDTRHPQFKEGEVYWLTAQSIVHYGRSAWPGGHGGGGGKLLMAWHLGNRTPTEGDKPFQTLSTVTQLFQLEATSQKQVIDFYNSITFLKFCLWYHETLRRHLDRSQNILSFSVQLLTHFYYILLILIVYGSLHFILN